MSGLFVTGAGTDVGKTHVTATLIRALRERGRPVEALKPVVSGFDLGDWAESDPGRLLAALGRPLDQSSLEAISPWRYAAPLAPDLAARLEGRMVDFEAAVAFCREGLARAAHGALVLVEGVGGVMSPVSETRTNLDWMADLAVPILLVGGSYLGAISHTLTAAAVIQARGLDLRAVVVSESAGADTPFEETVAAVARFTPGPLVVGIARNAQGWEAEVLAALA